jgi:hypothetical protein
LSDQSFMITNKLILIAIAGCILIGSGFSSFAATIPGGTTLVVQTVDTVSSQDRVGKKFAAQLDKDVVVNGTVLLRAGTKVVGKVETSRALAGPRSGPLALNLAAISSNGREAPIVTTGAFQPEGTRRGPRGRVSVTSSRYVFPHGWKMQLRNRSAYNRCSAINLRKPLSLS